MLTKPLDPLLERQGQLPQQGQGYLKPSLRTFPTHRMNSPILLLRLYALEQRDGVDKVRCLAKRSLKQRMNAAAVGRKQCISHGLRSSVLEHRCYCWRAHSLHAVFFLATHGAIKQNTVRLPSQHKLSTTNTMACSDPSSMLNSRSHLRTPSSNSYTSPPSHAPAQRLRATCIFSPS